MARYAISYEGIEQLKILACTLKKSIQDLYGTCKDLYEDVEAIGDDLGIYRNEIYENIGEVIKISKCAGESVQMIADIDIPDKIYRITELIKMVYGEEMQDTDTSERVLFYDELGQMLEEQIPDDEGNGPQKVLYKR